MPQAPREVRREEGVSPLGEGSGEGTVLPPQKILGIFVKNAIF